MKAQMEKLLVESGLWAGEGKETYRFVLSPDVYELSSSQYRQLMELGPALHECLAGISRLAAIVNDQRLHPHTSAWQMVRDACTVQVPQLHRRLHSLQPGSTPFVTKIDLVEGEDGRLHLVEIDAMNRRALGYAHLFSQIRELAAPGAPALPGVVPLLSAELHRRRVTKLTLLYAWKERFYLPYFHILRQALQVEGIELRVVSEHDEIPALVAAEDRTLLIDLPPFSENRGAEQAYVDLYAAGKISFLIPPKQALGSKAMLALLRNDQDNSEIEAILHGQIKMQSGALEIVRQAIPPTWFVTKDQPDLGDNSWVLKEAISSGSHGVCFSDDPHFNELLAAGRQAKTQKYIIQREINGRKRQLHFFGDNGQVEVGDWYIRVIAHYIGKELADAFVTACPTKLVHGAKDGILMGTIISSS